MDETQQPQAGLASSVDGLERPATVFLSYAREDTEIVRDLQLRLNVRGVRSWQDVDDLLTGSLVEREIVHAIEYDADAVALFLTPDCLKSDFIWRVEVPAALHRQERDSHFHIIPILQGVSFTQVQQFCHDRNLADLSRFHGVTLTEDGTASISGEEKEKKLNDAAKRILQAAFTLRLHRINADRNYVPWIYLRTFVFAPPTTSLDLYLDWLKLVHEKERLPTPQEWEQTLLPALLDVKHTISEKVPSYRIHLLIKSILPVAIALGFAFREPARITLLLEGQKETWSTEAHPSEKEPLHREWIRNEQGDQQSAVVEVATTLSIKQSVENALPVIGVMPGYHIRLESPELSREAVRDAAHAQAIASQVGHVCRELCGLHQITHIHLFVAIPVELAVLIGHQLNALCPITLYEYSTERVYKPVGIIR
jgi:SMODS-associated and fused to various effectors sensor domain/TIR domain